ncbi:hypothetical protein [Planomonospora venezuelensis]|uniref:Uncharacterized protein n=1 Tax=Planomonospora venezuelensis TaxID=1999 RepID=A0A841DI97_PLAVE|nr:hypothetical protein [Planomonospora venezuelensis]MBB5968028.1 hypothetical protein [Planomonospora venezuelensis]GIM98403.1 hypothetical protein Pve01_00620 [Planomonospora venezuelensis]
MLRHQLTALLRQMPKPAFTPGDRFVLAGLLGPPPMDTLRYLALLVRPETILRRHRDLIWNQRHLLHAQREFEAFYNGHRPHRALCQAAPLRQLPGRGADRARVDRLDVRRHDRLGGVLREYRHAT